MSACGLAECRGRKGLVRFVLAGVWNEGADKPGLRNTRGFACASVHPRDFVQMWTMGSERGRAQSLRAIVESSLARRDDPGGLKWVCTGQPSGTGSGGYGPPPPFYSRCTSSLGNVWGEYLQDLGFPISIEGHKEVVGVRGLYPISPVIRNFENSWVEAHVVCRRWRGLPLSSTPAAVPPQLIAAQVRCLVSSHLSTYPSLFSQRGALKRCSSVGRGFRSGRNRIDSTSSWFIEFDIHSIFTPSFWWGTDCACFPSYPRKHSTSVCIGRMCVRLSKVTELRRKPSSLNMSEFLNFRLLCGGRVLSSFTSAPATISLRGWILCCSPCPGYEEVSLMRKPEV